MSLRPEFALGSSEFNDFLYALIGEEKNGTELTVISALARLDLDPWGEAARLSGLDKEAATVSLTAAIDSLTDGNWQMSDTRSIAIRLIEHLPRHLAPSAKSSVNNNAENKAPMPQAQKWLLGAGLALAAVLALSHLAGD